MMTRMITAIGLVLALSATLNAQVFEAVLDGSQEDPPVATPGTGVGSAVYDPVTDTLGVSVSFSGLLGPTTDSHIHCCFGEPGDLPGRNSSVAVGFTPHGFPIGVSSGVFNANIDLSNPANYTAGFLTEGGGTAAGARNKLLAGMSQAANAGGAYFNIHTSQFPPGEIRGDISLIPEPASMLLMLCGLVGTRFVRKARR